MLSNPPPAIERVLLEDLHRRLEHTLGFRIEDARSIATGQFNNNRLIRLRAKDGREAVAKLYYRDQRRRLEREFGLLSFLNQRRVPRVPRAHLRCDEHYYAVYSFEPGASKRAAQLTIAEVVEIARFAADLQRFRLGGPGAELAATVASGSLAERVDGIRRQLRRLGEAAPPDAFPQEHALRAEMDVVAEIERLIAAALAGLAPEQIVAQVPPADLRLSTGDFAPNNVLVRPDGSVCVVDFEYAGWDDPLALAVDFLTHQQSLDLGREQVDAFLRSYRATADLPASAFAGFDRRCALAHVGWCAGHLRALDPTYVARKRFANPALDADSFVAGHIALFKQRLGLAETAIQRLTGN